MEYTDISDAILNGELDRKLDSIQADLNARYKVLQRRRAALAEDLMPGTRVKLVHVSPKAANGATGTITYETHNGKIGVILDYDVNARIRAGQAYTWPASCYEEIDS